MILELIFMIENFIFKLECSNGENAQLKLEINVHVVSERPRRIHIKRVFCLIARENYPNKKLAHYHL